MFTHNNCGNCNGQKEERKRIQADNGRLKRMEEIAREDLKNEKELHEAARRESRKRELEFEDKENELKAEIERQKKRREEAENEQKQKMEEIKKLKKEVKTAKEEKLSIQKDFKEKKNQLDNLLNAIPTAQPNQKEQVGEPEIEKAKEDIEKTEETKKAEEDE